MHKEEQNIYIFIYMNAKIRCKPRNMTNFNQKVKILKALNFGHDTESNFVKTILQYIKKI